MAESKSTVLCVLKILEKYSDENHILSIKDINKYLKFKYEFEIDRRTLYGCIRILREIFDYDISTYDENKTGYYLRSRAFEISEVKMMIDSICASSYIPEKQAKYLIDKILLTQSENYKKSLNKMKIFKSTNKTRNKDVFLNIEIIQEAIEERKKITFDYYEYGFDKKLRKRREKPYKVSPFATISTNENYYLLCKNEGYEDLSHFRIELISNIEILKAKISWDKDTETVKEFGKNAVYAYGGKPENIQLLCRNNMLTYVLDRFGFDVNIRQTDQEHFLVDFIQSPEGILFWALQFTPDCKILKPENLKQEMYKKLQEGLKEFEQCT